MGLAMVNDYFWFIMCDCFVPFFISYWPGTKSL